GLRTPARQRYARRRRPLRLVPGVGNRGLRFGATAGSRGWNRLSRRSVTARHRGPDRRHPGTGRVRALAARPLDRRAAVSVEVPLHSPAEAAHAGPARLTELAPE